MKKICNWMYHAKRKARQLSATGIVLALVSAQCYEMGYERLAWAVFAVCAVIVSIILIAENWGRNAS